MNIFCDLHHFDLYYSFHLLLEKRLGHILYRPIGYDWIENGYWKIHSHPIIVKGYLGFDVSKELNQWVSFEGQEAWARLALELLRIGNTISLGSGHYLVEDKSKGILQKAITLQAFKEMKFDIVISTLPWHFPIYQDLIRKYQPQAKHIFQVGNRFDIPKECKNLMYSSIPDIDLSQLNSIQYHQEFDTNIFSFNPSITNKSIHSYVHFPESEELIKQTFSTLSYKFIGKTLGLVKDIIISSSQLASVIQNSFFTWHIKPGGEGYGHILYNSFACGTPIITNLNDFQGCLGLELLEDNVTCIDVSRRSPKEIEKIVVDLCYNEHKYIEMRQRVYNRFCECVDFENEFRLFEKFLGRLQ